MENNELLIIKAVLAGQTQAYAQLVQSHGAKTRALCLTLLSNPSEAEDAAQDCFVKAFQNLKDFRGQSSFATWISRIAHNHCLDILRKKTRQKTQSLDQENQEAWENKTALPNKPETSLDLLREALATMSKDQQEILLLKEVQGLTYEEMAKVLNCSLDAVKSRLRRSRQQLQQKTRHFLDPQRV